MTGSLNREKLDYQPKYPESKRVTWIVNNVRSSPPLRTITTIAPPPTASNTLFFSSFRHSTLLNELELEALNPVIQVPNRNRPEGRTSTRTVTEPQSVPTREIFLTLNGSEVQAQTTRRASAVTMANYAARWLRLIGCCTGGGGISRVVEIGRIAVRVEVHSTRWIGRGRGMRWDRG